MKKEWYNLSWLPVAPDDFTQRCNALQPNNAATLQALAAHRLNDAQLNKLNKKCGAFSEAPNGLQPLKLGIIGNANSDFLKAALEASALRHGLWLDVEVGGMGQTVVAVLDPNSKIMAFKPDVVVLALTWQIWSQTILVGREAEAAAAIESLESDIHLIADTLKQQGKTFIIQTMPQAPISLFGSLDRCVAGTLRRLIDDFNSMVWASGLPVIDVAALAELAGLATWHDAGQWHWAKLPFSQNLIPLYAEHVTRTLGALRGRSRKCLVLDLDNTLWGGVIGDDGIEGIALGQGSPRGEAHLAIQHMALALRERGIVLAVCSKNEDATARLPFENHPEQILKESHIAVFQANWNDKASNLEAIAKALDLTPDALVFLDDNPAEREMVRRELPAIAVPEVPDTEPALWPQILSAAGYFEAVSFTESDVARAGQYVANVKRKSLEVESRNIDDYLAALEMEMEITSFVPTARSRVAQLINRSNQYNLTSRRYTENQIEAIESDPSTFGFSVRLHDRFGDNGIISVIICKETGSEWYIDTWLMSCRVLGRHVERAVLNYIAEAAKGAGKNVLKGHYIPTAKNSLVEEHYKKLGFQSMDVKTSGESFWQLDLENFTPFETPIALISQEPEKKKA